MAKTPHQEVRDAIRAVFGKDSARLAKDGSRSEAKSFLPTGLEVLDYWILGCGGLPGGRIIEVYGDEGAGKTSLSLAFLAAAQRAGGLAIMIETERTLEPKRMDVFGVNRDEAIIFEPDTLAEVLKGTVDVVKRAPPKSVLVWDTLAATKVEAEGSAKMGKRALALSGALPEVATACMERGVALVVVNQIRDKIGVVFGDPTTTPGGHATKFHSTFRLQLWRGAAVKRGEDFVGIHTTVKATKNKLAAPFKKAKLRLIFDKGWDNEWALLDWAKERGTVPAKAVVSAKNLELARKDLGSLGPLAEDARERLDETEQ